MIDDPNSVFMRGSQPAVNSSSPSMGSPYSNPGGYSHNTGYNLPLVNGHGAQYASPGQNIVFKDSPFFQFRSQLGTTKPCDSEDDCTHFPSSTKANKKKAMTQHRHTVDMTLQVSEHIPLQQAVNDKSLRVMIFCAGETSPQKQDVAFPHQSEIKVNGGEVKANLRGLKNKPGSTRPVDITDLLRLKLPNYVNRVSMTYALTNKASDASGVLFASAIPFTLTFRGNRSESFPTLILTTY